MAIAGIEPFSSDALYDEDFISDIHNAGDVYTVNAVREILIKFANSKNAMRRDMPVDEIVDEFMKSGEEE